MKPDKAPAESYSLLGSIALLWAGAVIGGSLIAAPAKFQVEELTMPVALLVGRAQFAGLAIAELILILLAAASLLFAMSRGEILRRWPCVLFAIAIFGVQHIALMPQLQERSLRIIAGETVEENGMHLVYVAVECLKVAALVLIGFQQGSALPLAKPKKT